MANKIDRTVVRYAAYRDGEFNLRERHNERKNESYHNGDIDKSRTDMNIHFRKNLLPDGTPETYEQTFNRLLAEEKFVKRGLKPDAKVFDELIFDVNSAYFENNGGYEYAKKFFAEAYKFAVKEIGGENYILSAVLHADEMNKALSEELGRDVYHYHLHVVYVPVVQKEIRWTKRAGAELSGKVKAVIPQINHTDKWPRKKVGGKFINEYSLLQDRYYEHMLAAGFPDLMRGERGSAAEHLSAEEYKYQQEKKRVAALEKQAEKKEAKLAKLDGQISVREKAKATIAEVDGMGHTLPLFPGVHLTDDEAKKLKGLAKKGVGVDKRADDYKKKISALEVDIRSLNDNISSLQQDIRTIARDRDTWKKNYERLWDEVKDFIHAIRRMPQKLLGFIHEHLPKTQNREAH